MEPIKLEHQSALRGLKIGRVKITKEMFDDKEEAVKAFQKRYFLKVTGIVDKDTAYKLKSIAASQGLGAKQIKRPMVDDLQACSVKRLSLNMITDETPFSAVGVLQKNLAYLGYKIYLNEHKIDNEEMKRNDQSVFGKSTLKAVKAFQKDENLPQTGIFDNITRKALNDKILKDRPKAKIFHPYRIRGSVRDIEWNGKPEMMIEVSEVPPFNKEKTIIPVEKSNYDNGFFDVIYNAPIDEKTGAVKKPFHIVVKLYDKSSTKPVATQTHHNVSSVHWVNFVQNGVNPDVYKGNYKGLSEYETIVKELKIEENSSLKNDTNKNISNKEILEISKISLIPLSHILKEKILTLSKYSAIPVNHIVSVIYAEFIREYIGDSVLESELFYAFILLNKDTSSFDNLLKTLKDIPKTVENLAIEIALLTKDMKKELIANAIKENLVSQQIKINTDKILEVLSKYQIEYTLSKNILVGKMSLNLLLGLSDVKESDYTKIALAYISTQEFSKAFWTKTREIPKIESFRKVVEIGSMVDNDYKILEELADAVAKPSDVAKLSKDDVDEKILIKAEKMYPAISLIAKIKNNSIDKAIPIELENFIDNNDKFNLNKDNIDEYITTNKIKMDTNAKNELKIVQRVHRITTNAKLAVKLLEQNIHNAHQIYGMGKARLTQVLNSTPTEVDKIYASAKMRHMQVSAKVLEYKELVNTHGFSVISTPEENDAKATLERLFGSMDYCECEHCKSLYGPTAYLTDILHFLNQQPSTTKGITVKDVLFERRADIGTIELSCHNTLTPIAYIDLVCEILENYILNLNKDKDKEHDKAWLYSNIIGDSNYAINNSFDLNAEQIESYLNYMQVPRYRLMETFNEEEVDVAMSFFGIRGQEKDRIIGSNNASIETTNASDFMQKTGLSYKELLLLVQVDYLNELRIENEGCTLEKQKLENVAFSRADSFIRLWKHTSWEMKELNLLIMHKYIGNKVIDNNTLINLKYVKQIQDILGLSIENILDLFTGDNSTLKPYMQDFYFFLEKIKYDTVTKPKELFNALNEFNNIQSSPLSLLELEYCLNGNKDSVIGLRKDTIAKITEELSEILKNSKDSDQSIKMHIAQSFDIEQQHASILIDSMKIFKKIELTEKIEFSEEDYRLLHRNALLISKMSMEAKDLAWFIDTNNFSSVETFNFNNYENTFNNWHNLYIFLTFKNSFPEPENASLVEVLTLAIQENLNVKQKIADLTQRDVDDILDGNYKEASFYQQLLIGFAQEKVLNIGMKKMKYLIPVADEESLEETVKEIREGIDKKSLDLLDNTTREKKRTALVEYLLLYSQKHTPLSPWMDSDSLYKHFLIDVEMSACQMTSRVKQALSSIQLFVQRYFLNLEENIKITNEQKEDKSTQNSWSQWKWMKNYRVWEANRKIFFYPENWLEPELRDDKTEIFKTLENALMQNEISDEYVEEVFKSYLHEMDELSDLEVTAHYHEKEDSIDMVHVIARTKAIPSIYYYRTYDMKYSRWSSWEKIDGDIDGDTLVPVVYNRKLHLFWLQFMEKPINSKKIPEAQPTDEPTDAPEASKVLEIQLVWSVKNFNGWSSKKISNQKLIHPWNRPKFSYLLKPNYKVDENELFINIYLSTSKEFNNTKFYDPSKKMNPKGERDPHYSSGVVWSAGDNRKEIINSLKNPTYVTRTRFNETYQPWHSSSFVFDGNVKEVRIKGLGNPTWNPNLKDSYDKIYQDFEEDGRAMIKFANEHEDSLKLPRGMHYHYNYLTNNTTNSKNINELKLLSNRYNLKLWEEKTPKSFRLIVSQQDLQLDIRKKLHPFFYQDSKRAFFIEPEKEYKATSFYHPYTALFMRELNRDGVKGLFNRGLQVNPELYVSKSSMSDTVDFSLDGANAIYNWELFFHAPLMIANRLMQNQKFEEAMKWFHYIFNPTNIDDADSPQRFWITKPFYKTSSQKYQKERIDTLLSNINKNNDELNNQLNAWKNNPFNPHVIASYRTVAYQKNVVMKYIDNLIAWGDMLFRRDSMESINEASLLYMLAYEILGKRPTEIKKKDKDTTHNYDYLEDKLNDISNTIENSISSEKKIIDSADAAPLPMSKSFYFCTPHNEQIAQYWDKVEDRLFKIRHCMNIKGIVRQLPLFEPPIDPALLVKATAAGMDISEVLNNVAATSPSYRFRVTLQKAIEFTNDLKQYGDKLLSTLEKKDAESLAILRSEHETELLEAVTDIRKRQIEEAKEQIKVLQKNRTSIEERYLYYLDIEKVSNNERLHLDKLSKSQIFQKDAQNVRTIASVVALIPEFHLGVSGFGGSPHTVMQMGGFAISKAQNILADILSTESSVASYEANRASILGGHDRRYDDWKLQERLAKKELDSIDNQILVAEIREGITQKELENHNKQIENSKSINSYMKNKFTNKELYNWMTSQVSTLYFQAYELAYSMAKKAEKSYNYELGTEKSNIIQGGYWDSLHKGLLSGDKLMSDLRKLDETYMEKNKRGFEITKHISLAQIFPKELMTLKTKGSCEIKLPEWLFDMDYPSHYMRRIKSVSLSIPCIVGPYTSVNCTLTLIQSYVRKLGEDLSPSAHNPDNASIVTSSGQNDSGMFELNFHDERYLPFEGAGVVYSEWKIEMPKQHNNFNFDSLSDVIMHINYVALADTPDNAREISTEMNVLFNLKDNFPTEWHRLKNDTNFDGRFEIKPEHLPFRLRPKINSLTIQKEYSEINKEVNALLEGKNIAILEEKTIYIDKSKISDEIENIYIIVGES
ncbi:MAG: neuraminidase-like domain-containing protein [Sulfurimonas sp.]